MGSLSFSLRARRFQILVNRRFCCGWFQCAFSIHVGVPKMGHVLAQSALYEIWQDRPKSQSLHNSELYCLG